MIIRACFHNVFISEVRFLFLLQGTGQPHPELRSHRVGNTLPNHLPQFLRSIYLTVNLMVEEVFYV